MTPSESSSGLTAGPENRSQPTPGVTNARTTLTLSGASIRLHRLEQVRQMYRAVAEKLKAAGLEAWLVTADGSVLDGPADAPAGLQPAEAAPTPGRHAGRIVVYAPVGRVRTDAFVAVEARVGDAADLVAALLPGLLGDAESLATLETAAEQSGERLVGAYEQMHAMFGLTRLLDGNSDAHHVVTRVLEEMCAVLDFGWLAVRFGEHPRLRSEVAGRLICRTREHVGGRAVRPDLRGVQDAPPNGVLLELTESLLVAGLSKPHICPATSSPWQGEYAAIPVRCEGRPVAVLLAGGKGGDDPEVSSFDLRFLVACADLIGVFHENIARQTEQRALFMGMVRALTASIDAKHRYTRGHSERVSMLAGMMATALGLPECQVRAFRLAGLLHDVGKIGIPEAILSKPTRLTDEEFEVIKQHPVIGHEILRGIPGLEEVLPGVLHHHEQYGGRGYPDGLAGEAIPLVGRVLALCDTFDAMSSSRSYREAMSRDVVLAEITRCAGRQFDPELARVFVTLDFAPFDALFASHGEENATAAAA